MTHHVTISDAIGIHNERVKLFAGFSSAIGLGLIGFAVLRPLVENANLVTWVSFWWLLAGLAFHGVAHYVLGYLKRKGEP